MRRLNWSDFGHLLYYNDSEDTDSFLTSRKLICYNGRELVSSVGFIFRASIILRRGVSRRNNSLFGFADYEC
jgi:hypothetical protein